jgi:hypothetical protein
VIQTSVVAEVFDYLSGLALDSVLDGLIRYALLSGLDKLECALRKVKNRQLPQSDCFIKFRVRLSSEIYKSSAIQVCILLSAR